MLGGGIWVFSSKYGAAWWLPFLTRCFDDWIRRRWEWGLLGPLEIKGLSPLAYSWSRSWSCDSSSHPPWRWGEEEERHLALRIWSLPMWRHGCWFLRERDLDGCSPLTTLAEGQPLQTYEGSPSATLHRWHVVVQMLNLMNVEQALPPWSPTSFILRRCALTALPQVAMSPMVEQLIVLGCIVMDSVE
jgi:hypothetical protein